MDIKAQGISLPAHVGQKTATPFVIALLQAIAALPTLLFWALAGVLAYLLSGNAISFSFALPYMLACNVFNGIMQGALISALAPLFPSGVGYTVNASLTFFFWTTPLIWPAFGASGLGLLMLYGNPLYYLAEGMRNALLFGTMPTGAQTLMFFIVSSSTGGIGLFCASRIYRRALPMSDILQ